MTMKERSTQSPHPSAEALAGFACDPQAARYAQVAAHVAECVSCQRQAEHATAVVAGLRQVGTVGTAPSSSPHLTAADIDAYITAREPAARLTWQQHIDICGDCRRAVLLHRTRLAAPANPTPHPVTAPLPASLSTAAHHSWLQRQIPVWSAVPLAMAAGLLTALALPWFVGGMNAPVVIASYQDDARIVFMPSTDQPGLGFFADAAQQTEPYAGLSLRVAGDTLELSWPAVADASGYDVRIVGHDAGSEQLLFEAHTEAVTLSTALVLFETGRRYSWELAGVRRDGTRFRARGGFVLSR